VTEGNGVNPAGSSSRLDRIEKALEVLIAQQQALTAQQQALTAQQQESAVQQQESAARQEAFMQSTNERLDRHEQMITNAVLGYVNMGEALIERVEVIAQRVEVMAEQVVRIVTHLDTVSLQVLGLQTENRRILDILQGR
jgi:flagellar biosynthesis/type III secretory pathway protein FliH